MLFRSVISGSMEPAIPTGSLVYIKEMEPKDVQVDDVIAFYGTKDAASIITHRVVENRVLMGEFITKGDANATKDMNPAPYDNFIGKVAYSIPKVGGIALVLTGVQTCALPICNPDYFFGAMHHNMARMGGQSVAISMNELRSEERRVGKECRSRWSPYH